MKTFEKLYEHLHWANLRILETLRNSAPGNPQMNRLFSHILLAEQVWLTRIRGIDSSQLPIWSEEDLSACDMLVKQNREGYKALFAELSDADLDRIVNYSNSRGKPFQTSIRDILTHVALHGQYHRGQLNSRLRDGGLEPVNVDFITFVR